MRHIESPNVVDDFSYFNMVKSAVCGSKNGNLAQVAGSPFLFSHVLQLGMEIVTCLNTIILMLDGKNSTHLK